MNGVLCPAAVEDSVDLKFPRHSTSPGECLCSAVQCVSYLWIQSFSFQNILQFKSLFCVRKFMPLKIIFFPVIQTIISFLCMGTGFNGGF